MQAVNSRQFDYVVHTASPFHNDFTDPIEGILNPAIKGTTGILRAIKAYAPSVKRVVVTSSFAAIINPEAHKDVYDETSWNPVTWDEAVQQRSATYRGSKVSPRKQHPRVSVTRALTSPGDNRHSQRRPPGTLSKMKSQTSTSQPSTHPSSSVP